jgi:2-dehydropantoate 2-reductase
LAAHGLVIETPHDRIVLKVNAITANEVKPLYDLVILSCKAYDLTTNSAAIETAMSPSTVIVPLLNGIAHLEQLDGAFGRARVMGGSCQIAATLTRDGVVKSMSDTEAIVWGARDTLQTTSQTALAASLGEAFAKTAVDWRVSENIMLDMWEKLAFLSTLAGMTCLMRASVGAILATADGKALMTQYLDTCIKIATREGYQPRPAVLARYANVLNSKGSLLTASMLRDIEAGNEVEADHIVGYMLNKARSYDLEHAIIATAYAHLQAYQRRRMAT